MARHQFEGVDPHVDMEPSMTLANLLFVLVLVFALATLVVLFVGVLSMGRDQAEATAGASRSNRLMVWRVRLQFITVLLMPLWYLASRT
jgi:Hypoxia induced protein conserved region